MRDVQFLEGEILQYPKEYALLRQVGKKLGFCLILACNLKILVQLGFCDSFH